MSTSSATTGRQLSDEQAEAFDHVRNALAVHATQLRERHYRARLLDEPAQLVASTAEQAEGPPT